MHIRQSLSAAQNSAKNTVRRIFIASFAVVGIAVSALALQNAFNPATVHAITAPESCFGYTTTDGQVTVSSYYGYENNNNSNPACPKLRDVPVVPATLGGNPVTGIGDYAFDNMGLTSVSLPDSLTSIGKSAFSNDILASVSIPGSVTHIGQWAFNNNSLTSVSLPPSLTSIEDYAFYRNLITSVTIPGSVTNIGERALGGNELTSVTIPGSVATIGLGAFSDNRLTSVTIPGSVKSMDEYAFAYNYLTSVTISDGVTNIGPTVFTSNSLTSVTVPSSVTSISFAAFSEQNRWGRELEDNVPNVPYLWSSDPAEVQQAYDSIWYVRVYTADPNNPQHLQDGIVSEDWWWGMDANNNGTTADSMGGHIINPAETTIGTLDRDGKAVQTATHVVGTKTNGSPLRDYQAVTGGNFAPIDPESPTTGEQAALAAGFAQYHRIGQTASFTAPTVAGYTSISPASPTSKVLTAAENTVNFTYAPTLTTVNFGSPVGSAANPTPGAVPAGLSAAMTGSIFTTDTSKECYLIDSAKLLTGDNFSAPTAGYSTVGGLDFTLQCTAPGKDATVSLALGTALPNPGQLKVYKRASNGKTIDITGQVTIANKTTAGGTRTVISYTITDGGPLDDDGLVNGKVSDPIYVVAPSSTSTTSTTTKPGGALADTGIDLRIYVGGALAFIAAASLIAAIPAKRHLQNR